MPKLFHTLLPGLLAITLGTTADAGDSAPATIEDALEERGWSVHRTFAGDLYLFAPSENGAAAASAENISTPTAKDPSTQNIDLQTLGNKLETAGWKVERRADGSLELHPSETAETTTQEKEPAPSTANEQWNQMQQQLNAAGWNASRAADGSLVLIPPGETAETTTQKENPAPSPVEELWDQMQKQLNAAGWKASRDADGSLVLTPPSESVEAAAPEEKAAPSEKQPDSMQTMQDKLKESGWQVTENSDGTVLFYPPEHQHDKGETIQPASGHAPPSDFDLPITSWSQARTLALKWLKTQSPGNLTVGKIREIYDVYLVSILTNSRSGRLKHQITVRKSDGHIIVLN